MKKLLSILLILGVLVSSISISPKKVEAKRFDCYFEGYLKYIKVDWKKQKKASKYVVYRAPIKFYNDDDYNMPKRMKFKKVGTTKKLHFKDKKAKSGKYYTYFVDAINKKGKAIGTTYDRKDSPGYRCKGLGKPDLHNGGYGEDHLNEYCKLYLYANLDYNGFYPKTYPGKKFKHIFYRKIKGSNDKYKKISLKKTKDGYFYDDTVKAFNTYQYKMKVRYKKGKKCYYSKYSDVVEITAVNFRASYTVESITEPGVYKGKNELDIVFKVKRDGVYDGKTIFYKTNADNSTLRYICYEKADTPYDDWHYYEFNLYEYSLDGNDWTEIPRSGVLLPDHKPLYLKGKIKTTIYDKDKTTIYYFGGDQTRYYSAIESDGAMSKYFGPGNGYTYSIFDFLARTGKTYQEWD